MAAGQEARMRDGGRGGTRRLLAGLLLVLLFLSSGGAGLGGLAHPGGLVPAPAALPGLAVDRGAADHLMLPDRGGPPTSQEDRAAPAGADGLPTLVALPAVPALSPAGRARRRRAAVRRRLLPGAFRPRSPPAR